MIGERYSSRQMSIDSVYAASAGTAGFGTPLPPWGYIDEKGRRQGATTEWWAQYGSYESARSSGIDDDDIPLSTFDHNERDRVRNM